MKKVMFGLILASITGFAAMPKPSAEYVGGFLGAGSTFGLGAGAITDGTFGAGFYVGSNVGLGGSYSQYFKLQDFNKDNARVSMGFEDQLLVGFATGASTIGSTFSPALGLSVKNSMLASVRASQIRSTVGNGLIFFGGAKVGLGVGAVVGLTTEKSFKGLTVSPEFMGYWGLEKGRFVFEHNIGTTSSVQFSYKLR